MATDPQSQSSPQSARTQGSDLALRMRQLLQQCDNLAQQIQALGIIAPFAQDDLLQALSGVSAAKEKLLVQLGQEVEQESQGNSYTVPSREQSGSSSGIANSY